MNHVALFTQEKSAIARVLGKYRYIFCRNALALHSDLGRAGLLKSGMGKTPDSAPKEFRLIIAPCRTKSRKLKSRQEHHFNAKQPRPIAVWWGGRG